MEHKSLAQWKSDLDYFLLVQNCCKMFTSIVFVSVFSSIKKKQDVCQSTHHVNRLNRCGSPLHMYIRVITILLE